MNIGFVNGPKEIRQARSRRLGVAQAALEAGIALEEANGDDFGVKSGYAAMRLLLGRRRNLTAVFCASDQLAIGAMRALREEGLRIPEDISILGYDDIGIAGDLTPALSTIRQPMEKIGSTSVDLLFESGDETRHVVYAPTLVERASTTRI